MAVQASERAAHLPGNLTFGSGGMSVAFLTGAFIKSAEVANGVWTLTFQNASGVEKTATLPQGWITAASEPASPFDGMGWYDTANSALKIYNGTAFAALRTGRTDAEIKSLINATQISALQGELADGQIPADIMRDDELTLDKLLTLLSLTTQELSDLFTGATIAGRVVTYTQNDGQTVQLTIPEGTAAADGVVASGAFSADGTALTLTLDTGDKIVIPVPARRAPIITDDAANPVAPTAANEKKLLVRNGQLFRQSVHHGVRQSVTWEEVTRNEIANYAGVWNGTSDLPLITIVGQVYYVRQGGHFVKATNTTGAFDDYVPPKFIGSFNNEADADRHVTALGNISAFIASTGPNQIQRFVYYVSAYTAGSAKSRIWERIDGDVVAAVARGYFGFRVGDTGVGESRVLTLVRPNGVDARVAALGVQVVYHTTKASYGLAPVDDDKLHILAIPAVS